MKKIFLIFSFLIIAMQSFSQDILTKKNGDDIKAKILEVSQNEFNVSTNPSATVNYNGATYVRSLIDPSVSGSSNGHDFRFVSRYNGTSKIGFNDYEFSSSIDPTGSYLAPYVTTIGLYDDAYELVAVAKIPSKPKSAPDYPINFIVRFDT